MKMEALALTASASTAASAFPGTWVRTVKQVHIAVLVYLSFINSVFVQLSCSFLTCYIS